MGLVYGTFLGGFLVHTITVWPWLLGGFFALSPALFAWRGETGLATALLGLVLLQYIIKIPKWPAFAAWMKQLNPRAYYKRCTIEVDVKDVQTEKSMLCYHPHGALCVGFSWNGAHSPEIGSGSNKGITYLIVDLLCQAPLFGWVVAWCGNLQGASASNMKRLMEKGANLAIIPGGFEEATLMEYGVERVVLKSRKGFIKYALRYGYRVHPVYTFGECDTYFTCNSFLKDLRMKLNKYQVPTVLFFGSGWMPLFPRTDAEVHTVVGQAVAFPKLEGAALTDAAVDEWHASYVAALVALFDAHKGALGKGHVQLEVR